MKTYLADGRYYEKQADVPKGTKFEAVEFPFSASPKADFIDWLNANFNQCPTPGCPNFVGETYDADETLRLIDGPLDDYPATPPPPNERKPKSYTDYSTEIDEAWSALPLAHKSSLVIQYAEEVRERVK
jgi:hypothetical protein